MRPLRPLSDVLGRYRAFSGFRDGMTLDDARELLQRELDQRRLRGRVRITGAEGAWVVDVVGGTVRAGGTFATLPELVDGFRRQLPRGGRWRR